MFVKYLETYVAEFFKRKIIGTSLNNLKDPAALFVKLDKFDSNLKRGKNVRIPAGFQSVERLQKKRYHQVVLLQN